MHNFVRNKIGRTSARPSGCAPGMARIKGAKTQERYRGEPRSGERAHKDVRPGLSPEAGKQMAKVPVAETRTPRTRSFFVRLFIGFLCDLRVFALKSHI